MQNEAKPIDKPSDSSYGLSDTYIPKRRGVLKHIPLRVLQEDYRNLGSYSAVARKYRASITTITKMLHCIPGFRANKIGGSPSTKKSAPEVRNRLRSFTQKDRETRYKAQLHQSRWPRYSLAEELCLLDLKYRTSLFLRRLLVQTGLTKEDIQCRVTTAATAANIKPMLYNSLSPNLSTVSRFLFAAGMRLELSAVPLTSEDRKLYGNPAAFRTFAQEKDTVLRSAIREACEANRDPCHVRENSSSIRDLNPNAPHFDVESILALLEEGPQQEEDTKSESPEANEDGTSPTNS